MKLKRIHISGFKSITDPLNLEFGEGVTCIVGPNGCGKSNISDAVKWVLGEQNPRNLRANRMQDLIFAGANGRKPEAMTEVRLTLDNEDRLLPISYAEVEIGRRLYRSGESEYRINKEVVRLKDIVDLFANTGIGTSTYSILEQGRVDSILRAKPLDRREIFEEAAGITKYRMRQDEALRKLKRTELDLQRIEDIIGELSRQVRSLKYQAGKAARYQNLQQELRRLELARMGVWRNEIESKLNDVEENLRKSRELKQSLLLSHQESARETEKARGIVEKAKVDLQAARHNQEKVQSEIQHHDLQLSHGRDMEAELLQQESRSAELERALSAELDQAESKLEDAKTRRKKLQIEILELEAEASRLTAREKGRVAEMEEIRLALEAAAKETLNDEKKIETLQQEQETKGHQLDEANEKVEWVQIDARDAARELEELDRRFEATIAVHDATRKELQERESERNELRQRLDEQDRRIEERRKGNDEVRRKGVGLRHRLDSLVELQCRREGHGEGVREALNRHDQGQAPFSRIQGILIEKIRVTKGYEDALETALSHWLEAVVAPDVETACSILDWMVQKGSGRLTCLPLDLIEERLTNETEVEQPEGVPEWAVDALPKVATELVEVQPEYEKLLRPVLRRTLVVEGFGSIPGLLTRIPKGWLVVAKGGEVAEFPGVISGGRSSSVGHLRRETEIEQLGATLSEIEKEIAESETGLDELKKELKSISEQLKEKESQIHELVIRAASKQEELQGMTQLREKIDVNLRRFEEELERTLTNREKIKQRLEDLAHQRENLQARLRQSRLVHTETQNQHDRIENALLDLRGKQASHREVLLVSKKDLERCEAEVQGLTERRSQIQTSRETLAEEKEERTRRIRLIERQRAQAEDALKRLFQRVDRIEEDTSELNAHLARQEEHCANLADQEKQFGQMLEEQAQKIQELEVEGHRTRLEKENLERRLFEELQSDWESCRRTAEELEDKTQSLEELSARISDVREKVSRIGEVNPLALEEFNEQNERLEFLASQQQDLVKARESLLRTISEVKRTARRQFIETFEEIRHSFNRTFRKMFGGGRADLLLLDEKDVLGSGVEIVAQPPGKKLQSITLFSGGEKSMTAIALMFAIYRVKASPFCFLDEVDAALDDANVDRFARILTDYRMDSQFIIVTHNKHTMAAADRLYGVTMDRPGISTVMAMEFENRAEYNLEPLMDPEEDPLPERNYEEASEMGLESEPELELVESA